jgi:hypothetical protein
MQDTFYIFILLASILFIYVLLISKINATITYFLYEFDELMIKLKMNTFYLVIA